MVRGKTLWLLVWLCAFIVAMRFALILKSDDDPLFGAVPVKY